MSPNVGWPSSISAVSPWTCVGPGSTPGIEQAGEAALDVAVVAERQRRDADDARLPGMEARRLDVDDGPAGAGLVGRPAPAASDGWLTFRGWHAPPTMPGAVRRVSATPVEPF